MTKGSQDRLELLRAARTVANFATKNGVPANYSIGRSTYDHIGALLADSILQAGLNYRSVVKPRVTRILNEFPDADRVSSLICWVKKGSVAYLLDWRHHIKVERFEHLVVFLHNQKIDGSADMRTALNSEHFCTSLRALNGIGPKTVDYMACLVGVESIAVDRHIRSFAVRAGLDNTDYHFLKNAFCFAADFLAIPRREFDAWIWAREANRSAPQLSLPL